MVKIRLFPVNLFSIPKNTLSKNALSSGGQDFPRMSNFGKVPDRVKNIHFKL
jgi:hypothetical protein